MGIIHAQSSDCDLQNGVLIGTVSYGINCLDQNGWNTFETQTSGLSVTSVNDVAICPDDQSLILVNIFGMNKFDGTAWNEIDVPSEVVATKALACAPGGELWATHISGVSHFNGGVFYGKTPCEGQSGQMLVTTNDNGEFTFENFPVGRYDMTFETSDGWVYFIGVDSKVEVTEGQQNDLAFIDISQ